MLQVLSQVLSLVGFPWVCALRVGALIAGVHELQATTCAGGLAKSPSSPATVASKRTKRVTTKRGESCNLCPPKSGWVEAGR